MIVTIALVAMTGSILPAFANSYSVGSIDSGAADDPLRSGSSTDDRRKLAGAEYNSSDSAVGNWSDLFGTPEATGSRGDSRDDDAANRSGDPGPGNTSNRTGADGPSNQTTPGNDTTNRSGDPGPGNTSNRTGADGLSNQTTPGNDTTNRSGNPGPGNTSNGTGADGLSNQTTPGNDTTNRSGSESGSTPTLTQTPERPSPTLPGDDERDESTSDESGAEQSGPMAGASVSDHHSITGECTPTNEILFYVQSARSGYWRVGAHDTYDGTWKRTPPSAAVQEYDAVVASTGSDEQTVTLERPIENLPAMWEPRSVSGLESVTRTANGGLTANSRLSAGTQYRVTSTVPTQNWEQQARSDQSVPDPIDSRYTQLPDDLPDRLSSHTDRITAHTDTTAGTVSAIRDWLHDDKSYSTDVSTRGPHPVDHFVFEMEKGFCDLFASAMTVMLRTQGVPARHVTGYTSGEQIGEDRYVVRNRHAHAWVEIYVDDVGWVPIEATPGGQMDVEGERTTPEFPSQTPEGTPVTP
ncbi:MAG: transglutaminaseTgpA domain-containing protein, partial [Halococcoides sp.]